MQCLSMVRGWMIARDKACAEFATRALARATVGALPVVGDRCKLAVPADRKPGSPCVQVAPAVDSGYVVPPVRRQRWPVMELVAVGREQQAVS
jgi:hypothetical protein